MSGWLNTVLKPKAYVKYVRLLWYLDAVDDFLAIVVLVFSSEA